MTKPEPSEHLGSGGRIFQNLFIYLFIYGAFSSPNLLNLLGSPGSQYVDRADLKLADPPSLPALLAGGSKM